MTPRAAGPGVVVVTAFRRRGSRGGVILARVPPDESAVRARATPTRVASMLALAHHLEEAIRAGKLRDRSDAARKLGLSAARVTQVMDLLCLAPDIQEDVLFLDRRQSAEPFTEAALRAVACALLWTEQRERYQRLRAGVRGDVGAVGPTPVP